MKCCTSLLIVIACLTIVVCAIILPLALTSKNDKKNDKNGDDYNDWGMTFYEKDDSEDIIQKDVTAKSKNTSLNISRLNSSTNDINDTIHRNLKH